jgi:tRNA-guanine family transglycosylase
MNQKMTTARGEIQFPAFFPVTTFGGNFPLDEVVRPYLHRFSPAVMVSHFYAKDITPQKGPVFIDSGGFSSLFKDSRSIHLADDTWGIQSRDGTFITPASVLQFQEEHSDLAATLDFIISPDASAQNGRSLQDRTIANAKWALSHRKQSKMKLYASLQAWDRESMQRMLTPLLPLAFDGFALGGMVPRIRKPKLIFEIVTAFRELEPQRPLHLFGIGVPRLVKALFDHGVSSVDSSNFVQQAASKRYLLPSTGQYVQMGADFEPSDNCPCNVCRQFTRDYLALEGELNAMALALHNLSATFSYLKIGKPHDG